MPEQHHILIIDDDNEIRYSLERVLSSRNYSVATASSGEEGISIAGSSKFEVIFLDNRMEGMSGLETLQHLRTAAPGAMVILMTAFGTTQTAIEAMKYGAFDYIVKPFDVKKIHAITEKALQAFHELAETDNQYAPVLNSEDYKEGIVGDSEPMQEVFKVIGQVATSDVTVMITGESGTGKELVARCIYQHSLRSNKPFIAVNCAAIPDNLIESELFGHEKGAFTGATQQRVGKFELCDGGTLFLDEIGDMALPTQTKILRALQEGEIQRVGGEKVIKVDVRLIAATNKDLESMVEEKNFREDLYYRLNVMRIRMPSLRDRLTDIPALVDFILQRLNKNHKTHVRKVSRDALNILQQYIWPGNVRELENAVQRSMVVAQGETILPKDLPAEILDQTTRSKGKPRENQDDEEPVESLERESPLPVEEDTEILGRAEQRPAQAEPLSTQQLLNQIYLNFREEHGESLLHELEREMVARAMEETGGNQVKASAILGMTRATLRKRIEQYGLRSG